MNNTQTFRALLETDHKLNAVFQEVAAQYIQEAHDAGIRVTLDDLMELSAVRLHAMTGQAVGDWKAEAHAQLPAFKRAAQEREAFQAIMDTQAERHEEELAKVNAMKPEDRISTARAMGATSAMMKGSQTKRDLTPEETAAAVRQIENSGVRGSARIAEARRLGLV